MSDTIITILVAAAMIAGGAVLKNLLWPVIRKYLFSVKVNAEAVLLNVQQTGISIHEQQQLILQLQVEPDQGKNFVTELKGLFSDTEVAALQPGARMQVTYNSFYYKKISIEKNKSGISPVFSEPLNDN